MLVIWSSNRLTRTQKGRRGERKKWTVRTCVREGGERSVGVSPSEICKGSFFPVEKKLRGQGKLQLKKTGPRIEEELPAFGRSFSLGIEVKAESGKKKK